jgi:hypothetical protein
MKRRIAHTSRVTHTQRIRNRIVTAAIAGVMIHLVGFGCKTRQSYLMNEPAVVDLSKNTVPISPAWAEQQQSRLREIKPLIADLNATVQALDPEEFPKDKPFDQSMRDRFSEVSVRTQLIAQKIIPILTDLNRELISPSIPPSITLFADIERDEFGTVIQLLAKVKDADLPELIRLAGVFSIGAASNKIIVKEFTKTEAQVRLIDETLRVVIEKLGDWIARAVEHSPTNPADSGSGSTTGPGELKFNAANINQAIPEGANKALIYPIKVGASGYLTEYSLRVRIEHAQVGDLYVSLISPDATEFELFRGNGVVSSGFDKIFGSGGIKIQGHRDLIGKWVQGEWKLKIVDENFNGATGKLDFVSLRGKSLAEPPAPVSDSTSIGGKQTIAFDGFMIFGQSYSPSNDGSSANLMNSWKKRCDEFKDGWLPKVYYPEVATKFFGFDCGKPQTNSYDHQIFSFASPQMSIVSSFPKFSLEVDVPSGAQIVKLDGAIIGEPDYPRNTARIYPEIELDAWRALCEKEILKLKQKYGSDYILATCGIPQDIESGVKTEYDSRRNTLRKEMFRYQSTMKLWIFDGPGRPSANQSSGSAAKTNPGTVPQSSPLLPLVLNHRYRSINIIDTSEEFTLMNDGKVLGYKYGRPGQLKDYKASWKDLGNNQIQMSFDDDPKYIWTCTIIGGGANDVQLRRTVILPGESSERYYNYQKIE